jgi:hypothetical protein
MWTDPETLIDVALDARAPKAVRALAAAAAVEQPGARVRLRIAARTCVDDDLREALLEPDNEARLRRCVTRDPSGS